MSVDQPADDGNSRDVDESSRPSLRKSTPGKSADRSPERRSALAEPLTRRSGVKLRTECFTEDGVCSWREAIWAWRNAVEDNRGTYATFENLEGEQVTAPMKDRFTPEKWDERYAKLCDLERGLRDEFGRRLHTVLLSFTASSTDDDGRPRSPVDHFLDIEKSNDARTSALDRILGDRRYERVALPEQHKSGYIHWHWAVFVDGPVEAEDFQPMIDSHLNNCPTAEAEAHEILPDDPSGSSVSVRHVGEGEKTEEVGNLAAYLTAYTLGGESSGDGACGYHDPLEAEEARQMMLTLLWATNSRYWRPSDGAQRHMSYEPPESEEIWELVGIRDGPDGELREVVPGMGGVTLLETWKPPPND